MLEKDWEILQVGDRVKRLKRERTADIASRLNEAPPQDPNAVNVESTAFQIVQIQSGVVTAVRLIDQTRLPGMRSVVTEAVELSRTAALEPAVDPAFGAVTYEWEWIAPARGEARLTGGFIVTRADGSVETERCPTETTKG